MNPTTSCAAVAPLDSRPPCAVEPVVGGAVPTPLPASPCPSAPPAIRFLQPDRNALDPRPRILDQLLPPQHPARAVWQFVEAMDLSPLLSRYKARQGRPGRPPIAVSLLVALWLYATLEGVGSAAELDRLCRDHDAYRWLCGGVTVNAHTLSDFRVDHRHWLRQQVIGSVAQLRQEKLVDLNVVGQDGLRVRASAGSDSLKDAATLEKHLEEAKEQWDRLWAEDQARAAARGTQRRSKQEAARLRGARERYQRLQEARRQLAEVAAARERREKGDGKNARVSETDPDCRKMKMPDGGWRPAYNLQFGTDLGALVVVGVEATNAGNDSGQMAPMVRQIKEDHNHVPDKYLADGGYVSNEDIKDVSELHVKVYMPLKEEKKQLKEGKDPYKAKKGEGKEVGDWRQRMGSEEGKKVYKERGKCEWTNAMARNQGLYQVTVRGLDKVEAVALWHALAINFRRTQRLRGQAEEERAKAKAAQEAAKPAQRSS